MTSDAALIGQQIKYEQKSYWRNPLAALFTFAFPIILFIIITALAGGGTDKQDLGAGIKLKQYYTPSILAYAIMSACFLSLSLSVVRRRESGVLKRFRGTPLPASVLITGMIGSTIIIGGLITVVVVGFGRLFFGVHIAPAHLVPVAVMVILAALTFCALGIAVSSFIPNDDSGPAVVNLPFFVLVFLSGTYFPISGGLKKVSEYFPLRPLTDGLLHCFIPSNYNNHVWSGHDVLVLAIWGAAATAFAVRHFRWVPRHG